MKRRDLLGAVAASWAAGPLPAQPLMRLPWPELRFIDGSVLPAADWNDVAAVVMVFATWCPFCQRHNAHVQALHQAHAGAHLRVIGAAIDRDPAVVRRYAERQGLGYPITMQGAALRELAGARAVIPTTIAVDRAGRLRTPIPGRCSAKTCSNWRRSRRWPGLPIIVDMWKAAAITSGVALLMAAGPTPADTTPEIFRDADLALGERLIAEHRCSACHARKVGGDGSSIYRPRGRIATAGLLRGMVEQCNTELNLALFPEEVTAVAAVLNRDHYRFR